MHFVVVKFVFQSGIKLWDTVPFYGYLFFKCSWRIRANFQKTIEGFKIDYHCDCALLTNVFSLGVSTHFPAFIEAFWRKRFQIASEILCRWWQRLATLLVARHYCTVHHFLRLSLLIGICWENDSVCACDEHLSFIGVWFY